jgi:hypothetical protein
VERGFFQTPNVNIPLNAREAGTVAPVGMEQLRSYQRTADNWPVYRVRRDGRDMFVCQECDQSLAFYSDEDENPYQYNDDDMRTLKVAHIRQAHDKDGTNGGRRQD